MEAEGDLSLWMQHYLSIQAANLAVGAAAPSLRSRGFLDPILHRQLKNPSAQPLAVRTGGNRFMVRRLGKSFAHSNPTATVAMPPTTIAGTMPHQAAVNPDSNSP